MKYFERTRAVIAHTLLVDEASITPDTTILDDLGAESVDLLDVLFRLEEEFGIKLPRGDIERRARGDLSDGEFATEGVLSEAALQRLQVVMPEVPRPRFVPGLTVKDIPRLMTVATFARLVEEKLDPQEPGGATQRSAGAAGAACTSSM